MIEVHMRFECQAKLVYGSVCNTPTEPKWVSVQNDLRRFMLSGGILQGYVALVRINEGGFKTEHTTVCKACFDENKMPATWMLLDYGYPR